MVLFMSWLLPKPVAADCTRSPAPGEKVDELMQTWMKDRRIPGLAVAVVRMRNLEKAQVLGLANVELDAPVRINTVFQLGSINRPFIATAILSLVRGEASSTWMIRRASISTKHRTPGRKSPSGNCSPRTSGIAGDRNQPAVKPGRRGSPGSNGSYDLLAMIIRKITGQSGGDFLRARIFGPLGMANTTVSPSGEIVPGLASGYIWENHRLRPGAYAASTTNDAGSGGLLSTIRDMTKWSAARSTRKTCNRPASRNYQVQLKDGTTCPCGFGSNLARGGRAPGGTGRRRMEHRISSRDCRLVDDHLTVIVLANRSPLDTERFARRIAALYVPAVTPPDYQPIPDPDPETTARVRDILELSDPANSGGGLYARPVGHLVTPAKTDAT